jgi:hypothetical protein
MNGLLYVNYPKTENSFVCFSHRLYFYSYFIVFVEIMLKITLSSFCR